jgi:hypothetical protein
MSAQPLAAETASLTYIETLTLLVFYEDKKQKANIECRILNVKC